ncbi:MAG: phage major capsid protein [Candidatus Omnitrophica bacterium]|nr:phage major capsid protein [Candidatus Omnitrophota bacterium]
MSTSLTVTYDTVTALTNDAVIKTVTDNVFNSTPFLKWLKQHQKTGYSGNQLVAPVEHARNTSGGSYRGSDLFTTTDVDTATRAIINWSDYYQTVTITGDDKDFNRGKAAIINLIDYKMRNGRKSLSYNLTAGAFSDGTGNSSKDLVGLKAAVDDSTNISTYANISRSTDTWWKAKYTALSDYISLSAMQSMYGDLTDNEDRPDAIITTQDVWDDIWELLTPIQRSDSEKMSVNYGFRTITFNGTPIWVDAQCPSGEMYYLNSAYINLYPLEGYEEPKWTGWKVPVNQDVAVGQLLWKGQLLCTNCAKQGRIVSITT